MVSERRGKPIGKWRARHFIGGRPILDFVNTVSDRVDLDAREDRLTDNEALQTWAISAGLISAESSISEQGCEEDNMKSPRELRERAWTVFHSATQSSPPPVSAVRKILSFAQTSEEALQHALTGSLAVAKDRSEVGNQKVILGLLAWDALELLVGAPRDRIKSCPRCGWLFIDMSKGRRRRWCSMKTCGNREKVSKHIQQHKAKT